MKKELNQKYVVTEVDIDNFSCKSIETQGHIMAMGIAGGLSVDAIKKECEKKEVKWNDTSLKIYQSKMDKGLVVISDGRVYEHKAKKKEKTVKAVGDDYTSIVAQQAAMIKILMEQNQALMAKLG